MDWFPILIIIKKKKQNFPTTLNFTVPTHISWREAAILFFSRTNKAAKLHSYLSQLRDFGNRMKSKGRR